MSEVCNSVGLHSGIYHVLLPYFHEASFQGSLKTINNALLCLPSMHDHPHAFHNTHSPAERRSFLPTTWWTWFSCFSLCGSVP